MTEARQAERSAAPAHRILLLQPQTPKHLQALSPCLFIYQKLYFDRKIPLGFKKLLGAPCSQTRTRYSATPCVRSTVKLISQDSELSPAGAFVDKICMFYLWLEPVDPSRGVFLHLTWLLGWIAVTLIGNKQRLREDGWMIGWMGLEQCHFIVLFFNFN